MEAGAARSRGPRRAVVDRDGRLGGRGAYLCRGVKADRPAVAGMHDQIDAGMEPDTVAGVHGPDTVVRPYGQIDTGVEPDRVARPYDQVDAGVEPDCLKVALRRGAIARTLRCAVVLPDEIAKPQASGSLESTGR